MADTRASLRVNITPGDIRGLRRSYDLALRASNRSARTVQSYLESFDTFVAFLLRVGMPTDVTTITREHVEAWIVDMAEAGRAAATLRIRYASLRQFFKFAAEEGEITDSPMRNMHAPIVPEQRIDVLSFDQVRAMLATCKAGAFEDLRDDAIMRLLWDTGLRRGELLGLKLEDLDFEVSVAFVLGKGRRGRAAPFGHKTARALDKYIRARSREKNAPLEELWISRRGRLSEGAVSKMLSERGHRAGVGHVHCHQFRHSFANEWLADGGNEGDLMRLGGWRSRDVMARYGAVAADDRAREAHRQRSPGDRL